MSATSGAGQGPAFRQVRGGNVFQNARSPAGGMTSGEEALVYEGSRGEHSMRVATLNVRTLTGRLPEVLRMGAALQFDILLLQEARAHADSHDAIRRAARQAGWQIFFSKLDQDQRSSLILLTRWPAQVAQFDAEGQFADRILPVFLHRPSRRPLLLVGVYKHSGDPYVASRFVERCMEKAAETGSSWAT